jgi:hypothetical protein
LKEVRDQYDEYKWNNKLQSAKILALEKEIRQFKDTY